LKFGGGSCDSSSISDLSMFYVKKAEDLFLAEHKKEILTDAARLIEFEINELKNILNK